PAGAAAPVAAVGAAPVALVAVAPGAAVGDAPVVAEGAAAPCSGAGAALASPMPSFSRILLKNSMPFSLIRWAPIAEPRLLSIRSGPTRPAGLGRRFYVS